MKMPSQGHGVLSACLTAALVAGCESHAGSSAVPQSAVLPAIVPLSSASKRCPISTCIYVTNSTDTITVYPANATGNVTPYRTIATEGMYIPNGIAIDRRGRTYVSFPSSSIQVYAALANGVAKPLYIISRGCDPPHPASNAAAVLMPSA